MNLPELMAVSIVCDMRISSRHSHYLRSRRASLVILIRTTPSLALYFLIQADFISLFHRPFRALPSVDFQLSYDPSSNLLLQRNCSCDILCTRCIIRAMTPSTAKFD
ncbi:hypothetical protein PMAYCL1PPCAC_08456 [Pristionchus mayeri]|uniref:Uncharacterized protein n=1 Tax=Pristionchus mayeri TaxID=1317129 RepID=A0AAN4ZFN8_9BILA|nr:hypothetical protein PMAYCL1PPCAC_08456 [Pristionchus mayeri]